MNKEPEYRKPFDNVVRSVFLSTWKGGTTKKLSQVVNNSTFTGKEILADIPCFPVNSSHIEYIGYSPSYKVLEIRFKNSASAFRYRRVSQEFWDDFVSAESFGSFFHKHIKNSGFSWIEIAADLKKVTTNDL